MSRVLSTEQAKSAIGQVQSIMEGGFTDQISALDAQGKILSGPNTWYGPLAAQFRGSTWPETKAAFEDLKTGDRFPATHGPNKGLPASTWGQAVENRIGKQGAIFRNAYPEGHRSSDGPGTNI